MGGAYWAVYTKSTDAVLTFACQGSHRNSGLLRRGNGKVLARAPVLGLPFFVYVLFFCFCEGTV